MKQILTAWAEHCTGPGWTNDLIWYLLRDETGDLSIRAIQPATQTTRMLMLRGVSEVVSRQLTAEVRAATNGAPR